MALSQIVKVSLAFAVVALLGVGCNKGDSQSPGVQPHADAGVPAEPTPDAGDRVPEGWQWYRSEEGGYRMAYPPTWKVTEDGGLYKDAPDLEEILNASWNIIESIVRLAPAGIEVAVFDPEGNSVDELWEAGGARGGDVDQTMTIDGEYGRLGICTGIMGMECISVIHEGRAYSINMYGQGLMVGDSETKMEIEQIINSFQFLR